MKIKKSRKEVLSGCTFEEVSNYLLSEYGLQITGMQYEKNQGILFYQLSSDQYSLTYTAKKYTLIIKQN